MPCCRSSICAALYLRGVSTGDFQDALTALPGADAPHLSAGVISRLTAGWQEDYDRWRGRDLSARRYVCIRADGVCLQARMEPQAECMPVIICAMPEGRKELPGFQVGVRESAQSWRELLVDLKVSIGIQSYPLIGVRKGPLWRASVSAGLRRGSWGTSARCRFRRRRSDG